MRVRSPAPREDWHAVLGASQDAIVYQTPAWLDCVCDLGGYKDASRLYEMPDGRRLVLPMVRRSGLPRPLAVEASMPRNWGFAGIVAPGELRPADVAAVLADLHEHGPLRRSLKPGPLAARSWAAVVPPGFVHVPHTVHTLDLSGGFSDVWKRFGTKTRTKVRKAERAGLVVDCDTTGRQVPVFYDLYRRAVERWAERDRETSPIARWHWNHHHREPLRKFRLVASRLGEACKIWVASLGGQPVAAIIVLIYGANAVYWRAAMDRDLAGPSRANYLLQRLAIEDACAAGCSRYHMGESSPSIAEFKRAFGALPEDYIEYRFERIPLTTSLRQLHRLPSLIADGARVRVPRDRTPEPPSLSG